MKHGPGFDQRILLEGVSALLNLTLKAELVEVEQIYVF